MSNEIVKILDADVVTAVENPHYRVDVAALNLARGLSRGDSLDTPAYKFQMVPLFGIAHRANAQKRSSDVCPFAAQTFDH